MNAERAVAGIEIFSLTPNFGMYKYYRLHISERRLRKLKNKFVKIFMNTKFTVNFKVIFMFENFT